jgi:hypothetical protein
MGGSWRLPPALITSPRRAGSCENTAPEYCTALYLRDRQTRQTYLLNQAWTGYPSNRTATLFGFTPDSRHVIYHSAAEDILPGLPAQPADPAQEVMRAFIVDIDRLIGN